MSKKQRIKEIPCRRCGKPLWTLVAPIRASKSTQAKWAGICRDCITPAERAEMEHDFRNDIAGKFSQEEVDAFDRHAERLRQTEMLDQ